MTQSIDHQKANSLLAKIALGLLIFVVAAFALKVTVEPERLVRYSPLVTLHGLIMAGWMVMLASQARLAARGKLRSHRKFGRWSPLLVLAMVTSGMTVSWNVTQEFGNYTLLIANIGNFSTFVPLYIVAIFFAHSHKQAEHRQAMLLATLGILGPAYGRLFDALDIFEPAAGSLVILTTLALPIWLDRASRGSVAKSTWLMIGFSFAVMVATIVALVTIAPPNL
jgi:hypothetical protein